MSRKNFYPVRSALLESPAVVAQVLVVGCIFVMSFVQRVGAVEHKLLADIWADGDEFGYAVVMDGDYAIVGAPYDDDNGADSGSGYIFHLMDGVWVQEFKLTASDGEAGDYFGYSVGICGEYAIVGAYGDDDLGNASGSCYVFKRGATTTWGQVKKLTAADGFEMDDFGYSVSISGDYAIVGAPYDDDNGSASGSAYLFYRNQGGADNWGQLTKLLAGDGDEGDVFGCAVCIWGDYVVIGAYGNEPVGGCNSGAAYVFYRNQGGADNWGQQDKLIQGDPDILDHFGQAVCICGDYAIIGAPEDDEKQSNAGAAYIFEYNAGSWGQVQKLMDPIGWMADEYGHSVAIAGSRAVVGAWGRNSKQGEIFIYERSSGSYNFVARRSAGDAENLDQFGCAVAVSGDNILCGANQEDDYGDRSGSVYAFYRAGSTWTEQHKVHPCDGAEDDRFGWAVAVDGNYAIVGARQNDDDGEDSGSAYIFHWDGSTWNPYAKLTAEDADSGDYFGCSVSIDGDYAVVGAYGDDDNGVDSGSVYIFYRNEGGIDNWGQQAKLVAADGAAQDRFGWSVGLSKAWVLVGAYLDDDAGSASGSAYVFYRDQGGADNWGQHSKLTADRAGAGDQFGFSVSLAGSYALIGAYGDEDNGSLSGSAYVFSRTFQVIPPDTIIYSWDQQSKLLPADGAAGDQFGTCVSTDGTYAIVGAAADDDNGSASGSAYIFARKADAWAEEEKLIAADGSGGERFGDSVAICSSYAVVGCPYDSDNGTSSGSVYLFVPAGNNWRQRSKLLAEDGEYSDYFGSVVSISGDNILVGAYGDDDNGLSSGSAYLIERCLLEADLTGDCHVDWQDVNGLCEQWLESGDPAACPWTADLTGDDCLVNFRDQAVLAGEWLR